MGPFISGFSHWPCLFMVIYVRILASIMVYGSWFGCVLISSEQYSEATLNLIDKGFGEPNWASPARFNTQWSHSSNNSGKQSSSEAPWSFRILQMLMAWPTGQCSLLSASIFNLYKALHSWISGFNSFSSWIYSFCCRLSCILLPAWKNSTFPLLTL